MSVTAKLRELDEARLEHRIQKIWVGVATFVTLLVVAIATWGIHMMDLAPNEDQLDFWQGLVGCTGLLGGGASLIFLISTINVAVYRTAKAVREANYAYHDALEAVAA